MRFNLVVNIELPESGKTAMCSDPIGFLQDHLTITENKNVVFNVLSAVPIEQLEITKCGFPEVLVRYLNHKDIYHLYDFNKYKLSDIYMMLNKEFCYSEIGKYISLIHNAMKKYGLSYADTNIDSLIPLADCGMTARTVNSLTRAGYIYLQDISLHTKDKIIKTRNFGTVSRLELERKMIEYGLWYSDV